MPGSGSLAFTGHRDGPRQVGARPGGRAPVRPEEGPRRPPPWKDPAQRLIPRRLGMSLWAGPAVGPCGGAVGARVRWSGCTAPVPRTAGCRLGGGQPVQHAFARRPGARRTRQRRSRSSVVYAVVKAGGRQHKVAVGDRFTVNRLVGESGGSLPPPPPPP